VPIFGREPLTELVSKTGMETEESEGLARRERKGEGYSAGSSLAWIGRKLLREKKIEREGAGRAQIDRAQKKRRRRKGRRISR